MPKTMCSAVLTGGVILLLAACGAPASSPTPAFANRIDVTGPGLYVDEAGSTSIDLVSSAAEGWLCIHADQEGVAGPVLGCSAVPAGESRNVGVSVDLVQLTLSLHTALYVDAGEAGRLEIPDPDVPAVTAAGQPVSFEERLVGDLSWITVADQQLGDDATVVVPRVYTPIPALLVIHNGVRGPAVGWAPLQAGENLNVTVTLAIAGEIKPLGAMLHWDGPVAGQYETFNLDPPASTQAGDLLVVPFSGGSQ